MDSYNKNEKNNKAGIIDLIQYAEITSKNRKPIAKITCGFIIIAILFLLIAPPVYESKALLQIKQEQGLSSSLLDTVTGGSVAMSQQKMYTYAEILKSEEVVVPVIEATEEKEDGEYPEYEKYVEKMITTQPFRNTELLQVTMRGKTAEDAQKANQLLVDSFLKRITELSHEAQTATKDFLEKRTKSAKEELEKAEAALQQYKTEHKILSPSDNTRVFMDQIAEVEKQAAINQVELEAAQAKLNAINRQLGSSGAASADNRTIQQYNAELAKLEAERISYHKFTEKNPKLIDVNNRIAKLKEKIRLESQRIASLEAPSDNVVHQGLVAGKYQSESEVAVAQQKAAALQQLMEQNNNGLEKLTEAEKGYVAVARDVRVANEIYAMLAKRLEEAKVAEVMQPNNVQLVSKPNLQKKPVFPRKGITLAVAALLGLVLSSGYIVIKELMNKTVRTEEDFKDCLDIPLLGMVPDANSIQKAMEAHQKEDEAPAGWFSKVKEYVWKK